jgi:molecular chaperone HscB
LGALEASFHVLSRRFHPDFYQTQSSRAQAVSLENSAWLNVAYRTLRDPVARVEYLLELEGLATGTRSDPPAELFEEILELQEARQEHRASKDLAVRSRLQGALSDLRDRKAAVEEEL